MKTFSSLMLNATAQKEEKGQHKQDQACPSFGMPLQLNVATAVQIKTM